MRMIRIAATQIHSRKRPNQALQRTRPSRSGCNRGSSWAGSLSLGHLARSMRRTLAILLLSASCASGQPTVVTDDKLPPDSIELKRNDPPATSTPWQLPKPGDPLYDAAKEAQINRENAAKVKGNSHLVNTFERGVFKGYDTLSWGPPGEKPAKTMGSAFIPNPKMPPDAVELSASEKPDKSDYFPTRPKTRPGNVPPDYIAVRVFHRGKVFGWTYMSKEAVAMLHKPKKT